MKLLERFLAEELGFDPGKTLEQFRLYEKLLLEWNEKINLISRKSDGVESHVLNSIFFLKNIDLSGPENLIDIGTGGGFPGIPLKILFPDMKVTLADSIRKKITAVNDIIARMNLKDVYTVASRAEELARMKEYKIKFDVITAKGVAPLSKLYQWSSGLQEKGGSMIFIKGGQIESELNDLNKVLKKSTVSTIDFEFDPVYGIEDKKAVLIAPK